MESSDNQSAILHTADDLSQRSWDCYQRGSFSEASNALATNIVYVVSHRGQLTKHLDLGEMLYMKHARLAYMLLYSGDVDVSCDEFEAAYHNYKLMLERERLTKPISRSQFIDYVIQGIDKLDAKSNVVWKHGRVLDVHLISVVKSKLDKRDVE
jgi:hypothetical protein